MFEILFLRVTSFNEDYLGFIFLKFSGVCLPTLTHYLFVFHSLKKNTKTGRLNTQHTLKQNNFWYSEPHSKTQRTGKIPAAWGTISWLVPVLCWLFKLFSATPFPPPSSTFRNSLDVLAPGLCCRWSPEAHWPSWPGRPLGPAPAAFWEIWEHAACCVCGLRIKDSDQPLFKSPPLDFLYLLSWENVDEEILNKGQISEICFTDLRQTFGVRLFLSSPDWLKNIHSLWLHLLLYVQTHAHARTHTHTHARTHIGTHTHMHTHTHTHAQTHTPGPCFKC